MSKIVLIGYMGSGKTTIAKKLAEKLNDRVYDLDQLIEQETGMSVKNIFTRKGEVFFRKKEHEVLKRLLETEENFILSLGGGTPCYANNHLVLQQNGVDSVYLKSSVSTLIKRLENHIEERPLLNTIAVGQRSEYIAKHLFERSYYYLQAKHIVITDDKKIDEIVEEIIKKLA